MTTQRNIFSWVDLNSSGVAPVPNFWSRNLAPSTVDLIERYQIGDLQNDIVAHRVGHGCSQDLYTLIGIVSGYSDAANYPIFRGLALDNLPRPGDVHDEPSLNGWSLYPKTALGLAKVQRGKFCVIMRENRGRSDPAFYMDEWENEILRPPLRKTVCTVTMGTVNKYGVPKSLWIVDIG